MHHFHYRNGTLHAEDVPIADIAAAVGTPFYCYSTATLERHYRVFDEAFAGMAHKICYSLKANSNLAVLKTLARMGAGADVVSAGEIERAVMAGFAPQDIVFSGVGKTAEEIALALDRGLYQFNVESEGELEEISRVATAKGAAAPITFRVNPDVDAMTHTKIATGRAEDKFGVSWQDAERLYARAADLPGIRIVGLDVHIGSQLTALEPFEAAFRRVADLVRRLREEGHCIDRLDLGGGLGVPYGGPEAGLPPLPSDYGRMVRNILGHLDCELLFEPGRVIVGNAGVLVSRVVYVKKGESRNFLVLDAAMNDLLRPSLYDAYHDIVPVRASVPDGDTMRVDVVGPVCETGDRFAADREMPILAPGDLVAIMTAGAYGAVMSSMYNSRPLVPEVLVNGDAFATVRRRPDFGEMVALEATAPWLK